MWTNQNAKDYLGDQYLLCNTIIYMYGILHRAYMNYDKATSQFLATLNMT